MADRVEVGTLKIWDVEIPVSFEGRRFRVEHGGRTAYGESWDELEPKAKELIRKARVRLNIRFMDPETGQVGVAVGRHATRAVPSVEWADGTKTNDDVKTPLRPETDFAELKRLRATVLDAERALDQFMKANRHPLDASAWSHSSLNTVVAVEIERAAKGADTP